MSMVCRECNRKFDLTNETDAQEFYFGHDCETEKMTCEWFLLCDNEATQTEPHPIVGDVPICDRCKDKLTAIENLSKQQSQEKEQ